MVTVSVPANDNSSLSTPVSPPPFAPQHHGTTPLTRDAALKIFNTAIVSSRQLGNRDFSAEIGRILESRAFETILESVRLHAQRTGLSELQAAEELISTFRKIDQFWMDFLLKEGIERIRQET